MFGLVDDRELTSSRARVNSVHRSLQYVSTSPQLGPGAAQRPAGDCDLDRRAHDGRETSRPSWRPTARVRARGVSRIRICAPYRLYEPTAGARRLVFAEYRMLRGIKRDPTTASKSPANGG